jgi:hypothetical protein
MPRPASPRNMARAAQATLLAVLPRMTSDCGEPGTPIEGCLPVQSGCGSTPVFYRHPSGSANA